MILEPIEKEFTLLVLTSLPIETVLALPAVILLPKAIELLPLAVASGPNAIASVPVALPRSFNLALFPALFELTCK